MWPTSFLFLQSVLLGSNLPVIFLDASFLRVMAMSVLFTTKCSVPRSAWNRVCMCSTGIVEGRRARRREGGEGGGREEGRRQLGWLSTLGALLVWFVHSRFVCHYCSVNVVPYPVPLPLDYLYWCVFDSFWLLISASVAICSLLTCKGLCFAFPVVKKIY